MSALESAYLPATIPATPYNPVYIADACRNAERRAATYGAPFCVIMRPCYEAGYQYYVWPYNDALTNGVGGEIIAVTLGPTNNKGQRP